MTRFPVVEVWVPPFFDEEPKKSKLFVRFSGPVLCKHW